MTHRNGRAVALVLAASCIVLAPHAARADEAPKSAASSQPQPPLPLLPPAAPSAAAPAAPVAPAPPPPFPPPTVVHTVTPEAPPAAAEPVDAAATKRSEDATPDHDRMVGHVGVTYFNITALPIANPIPVAGASAPQPAPGGVTGSTVSAPVVGVRYWLKPGIGIDAGLGLGIGGGSQEAVSSSTDTKVDKTGTVGFALHGGLPIALYRGHHYTFLVVPQFTVGGTGGTYKPGAPPAGTAAPEQNLSGFLFDIGALVGAEIHFGFIGVPELALQATMGLSYRRTSFKWKSDANSASDGTDAFGTNLGADPWAIFTNNISATYYF